MLTNQWERALKDVISEVLETMFFTVVDFDEQCTEAPFQYESEIDLFDKNGRIGISVCVTGNFAAMITANLLGVDEEGVGEEDMEDAIREFTNMIGGNYHARIKNSEWSLGIPKAWKIDYEGRDPATASTGLCFGCFGESAGFVSLKYHDKADGPAESAAGERSS